MDAPVAIVGGGISGLSTAYYLAQAGIPSTLIEARPRLGGVIQTEHVEGCVIEAGPDSFLSMKPAAMELIRELGLADEVIGSHTPISATLRLEGWPAGAAAGRSAAYGAHQAGPAAYHPAAELAHQAPHGDGALPPAGPPSGRSIRGGLRRVALRRRSRGLPRRAAALRHLRRQPQRAQHPERAAAVCRAGSQVWKPHQRRAGRVETQ